MFPQAPGEKDPNQTKTKTRKAGSKHTVKHRASHSGAITKALQSKKDYMVAILERFCE